MHASKRSQCLIAKPEVHVVSHLYGRLGLEEVEVVHPTEVADLPIRVCSVLDIVN